MADERKRIVHREKGTLVGFYSFENITTAAELDQLIDRITDDIDRVSLELTASQDQSESEVIDPQE